MKKALLFLILFITSSWAAMAQTNLHVQCRQASSLRSALEFQNGYSYFNRDIVSAGAFLANVGPGQNNCHVAAAIKLPYKPGTKIKGIQFVQNGNGTATIFVAERRKDGFTAWNIKTSKTITDTKGQNEVNTCMFDAPFVADKYKEYVVGYETVSTSAQNGPVCYSRDFFSRSNANLLGYQKDGSTNIKDGSITLKDISFQNLGNAVIVALVEDDTNELNSAYYMGIPDLGSSGKIAKKLTKEENTVKIDVFRMTSEPATSATVEVSKNGEAPQSIETTVNGGAATIQLGELSTPGKTSYTIVLKKVNGKPILFTEPTFTTSVYSVKLQDPDYTFVRTAVMVEHFTTEKCKNCPAGDKRLEEAYKEVNFPVVVVSHHVGYYTDVFTIKGDEEFLWKAILPYTANETYAPAIVLNRINNQELKDLSSLGKGSIGMYMGVPRVNEIVSQLNFVKEEPSEAKIMEISREKKGATYTYTISGKVSNDEEIVNDLYISMYLTEDEVTPNEQAGAGSDFLHMDMLRKFITDAGGQKVACNNDGTFTATIEGVSVPTKDAETKNFVIFIHRNPFNKDYNKRYIHSAVKINVATEQGVTELPSEDAPQAYAQNGHIYIKGMADSFVVYSISGEQVATSSNEQLPQGIYIVRIQLADSFYTSKVVVR